MLSVGRASERRCGAASVSHVHCVGRNIAADGGGRGFANG